MFSKMMFATCASGLVSAIRSPPAPVNPNIGRLGGPDTLNPDVIGRLAEPDTVSGLSQITFQDLGAVAGLNANQQEILEYVGGLEVKHGLADSPFDYCKQLATNPKKGITQEMQDNIDMQFGTTAEDHQMVAQFRDLGGRPFEAMENVPNNPQRIIESLKLKQTATEARDDIIDVTIDEQGQFVEELAGADTVTACNFFKLSDFNEAQLKEVFNDHTEIFEHGMPMPTGPDYTIQSMFDNYSTLPDVDAAAFRDFTRKVSSLVPVKEAEADDVANVDGGTETEDTGINFDTLDFNTDVNTEALAAAFEAGFLDDLHLETEIPINDANIGDILNNHIQLDGVDATEVWTTINGGLWDLAKDPNAMQNYQNKVLDANAFDANIEGIVGSQLPEPTQDLVPADPVDIDIGQLADLDLGTNILEEQANGMALAMETVSDMNIVDAPNFDFSGLSDIVTGANVAETFTETLAENAVDALENLTL